MTPVRPDLDALLVFWQPILRVADWDIAARYERHLDRSGYCSADPDYKRAEIRIVDPIDWLDAWRPLDPEKRLVHELVHLHFAAFKFNDPNHHHWMLEEQAVEAMARGMIDLRRLAGGPR